MTLRTTPPPHLQLKTTAQRRSRIEPELKSKLEAEYENNPKPNKEEKHRIALLYNMTDENVHNWFQNRRARASRELKMKSSQGRHHVYTSVSSSSSSSMHSTDIIPGTTNISTIVTATPISTISDSLSSSTTVTTIPTSSSSSSSSNISYISPDNSIHPQQQQIRVSEHHHLPPIHTLWHNEMSLATSFSGSGDSPQYSRTHTSFITPFYYHPPFGIETSYLKWSNAP
ncbi:uncharacterized protein BX664DRAFT_309927 [Halteromyces radiatus]|uniref:uncharacterized protein n=1 Tax=Halteromyces radiatus TaxID=101107 RepID=UPI0022208348|nr:uncharacterized protein BX664DRAFT_309927 [Halteromyces radiatus]KAI8098902.1 hypothetical protein BX664DRAFT_309927 [Halteromyces radiatus]